MADKSPAFSFYPKDYESDELVKMMSLEQEGAYVRLLCHSWLHGSIPADVAALSRICRTTLAKMQRLWPGIEPCWKPATEGRMVNGRQERERAKQVARSESQSEKGKKGGRPKKPEVSPGFDLEKAHESLPSPFPFASAKTDERKQAPANPLMAGRRDEYQSKALRLTRELADLTGREPTDVFADAAHFEGAQRRKVNPAAMTDDRLANTVADLEATLKAEQSKRGRAS